MKSRCEVRGAYRLVGNPDLHVAASIGGLCLSPNLTVQPTALLYDPNVVAAHPGVLAEVRSTFNVVSEQVVGRAEPTASNIELLARQIPPENVRLVVALGGGSTIDTGKGVAFLSASGGRLPERFESPGRFASALPLVAFPTTAGPGAELSPAMVYAARSGERTAIVDVRLVPRVVCVIPGFATSLPLHATVSCAFDGISHSIESMLSTQGTIYSTSLAASALELLVEGLRGVIRDPMDVLARETLATGAVISAQGLRVAGVGAPHAFAAALAGVLADVRHGPLVFASMLAVLGDELRTQRSLHNLSAVSCRLSFSDDRAMLQHFAALYSEHVAGTVHVGSMRRHGLHEVAREVTSHPRLITHPSEMNCDRVKRIAAKIRGVLKLGDIDGAIAE